MFKVTNCQYGSQNYNLKQNVFVPYSQNIVKFPHSPTVSFQGKTLESKSLDAIENSLTSIFKRNLAKIKTKSLGLSVEERSGIIKKLKEIEERIKTISNIKLQLGRLLDYDDLKKDGVSSELISKYAIEDDEFIQHAEQFTDNHLKLREYMFGYPANMGADTAVMQRLRQLEANLSLINGCGDSYEIGNYSMDAKLDYEQPILNKIYAHLGLKPPEMRINEVIDTDGNTQKVVDFIGPWGYITPGGSESNKWGITNGLRKYPNAVVYYSKAAHYSVPKAVKMNVVNNKETMSLHYVESEAISTSNNSEKINVEELISRVKSNWDSEHKPAVILLTWGTTKTGAIDDVAKISKRLKELNIDFYIHLDAAMYGGIAKNQVDAPVLPNMNELGVDSISMSLHKYFGSNGVNSIVIAKTKPTGEQVDYIGVTDSTTSGSRTFSPFSTLQRVVETLERKQPNDYNKNVLYFDNLLKEHNIAFSREENANTFIIDKPSDKICKKYQLSVFKDDNGKDKAHIIIFPYHKERIMREFVKNLGK